MSWNSGRRISAVAYGSAYKTSAGILSDPAAFPFFIDFIASKLPSSNGN
jgi:hypothetical protein